MASNYLLGKAESLMKKIEPPKTKPGKIHPYTFEQSQSRLLKKLPGFSRSIAKSPESACPNGETVSLITIHPSYLAKSYFPSAFLKAVGLTAVGSRQRIIAPDAPSPKREKGDKETGLELFVSGQRQDFIALETYVSRLSPVSSIADDIKKLEDIRVQDSASKIRVAPYNTSPTSWEAVLHISQLHRNEQLLESFASFALSRGGQVDLSRRMYAGGLCFVPFFGDKDVAIAVAEFSFLRVLRGMPRIRPVIRTIGSPLTFNCKVPSGAAMDASIRAVVLDGGPADVGDLLPWVRNIDAERIGAPDDALREHAIGVASAALFGPISQNQELSPPYANVDVVRVLDRKSNEEGPDYFDVLRRIDTFLADNECDFVNLSLGPDWPVEDEEPHAWTSILDRRFYEKRHRLLAFCAVGNNGEKDWLSGNARVQPPSDCVNAVAVGSCNSVGIHWRRSAHSCIGPGRTPGRVRPEVVAFGGDAATPYFVLGPASGTAVPVVGTSFASPTAMRTATGIRASLGNGLQPMAIRALMINRSEDGDHSLREVGWGRIQHTVSDLLTSDNHTAHIIYQKSIRPGEWISAEIPIPEATLSGLVELSATLCYAAPTEPENPINYTTAGLEVRFRPHVDRMSIDQKTKKPTNTVASRPLFSLAGLYPDSESELRADAHKWETVLHVRERFRGTSLKKPSLEIHYNSRESGGMSTSEHEIAFALVVTIRCKSETELYNKIVARYPGYLVQLKPIRLPAGRV